MPIGVPGMPITGSGMMAIVMPGMFPQGEVTLDITVGKLFLSFELREKESANQEIVHAKNQ